MPHPLAGCGPARRTGKHLRGACCAAGRGRSIAPHAVGLAELAGRAVGPTKCEQPASSSNAPHCSGAPGARGVTHPAPIACLVVGQHERPAHAAEGGFALFEIPGQAPALEVIGRQVRGRTRRGQGPCRHRSTGASRHGQAYAASCGRRAVWRRPARASGGQGNARAGACHLCRRCRARAAGSSARAVVGRPPRWQAPPRWVCSCSAPRRTRGQRQPKRCPFVSPRPRPWARCRQQGWTCRDHVACCSVPR